MNVSENLEEILDAIEDIDKPSDVAPVTPEFIRNRTMKMNWKGWLVLAGIVLAGAGFLAYHFGSQSILEGQLHAYESRIEEAVNQKIDVTDIEIVPVPGSGDALWIYLHSGGQTVAPLNEKEFEAVDAVFMEIVEWSGSSVTIWGWVNPAGEVWYLNVITVCESPSLLINRDNPDVDARCQTQQMAQPLDAKHLRWLNDPK